MSLINLSIQHGRPLDDAKAKLRSAVSQVQTTFPSFVQQADFSPDGTSAKLIGRGFDVDLRVDATLLHCTGNITMLGGLLGKAFSTGLKQILHKTFPKRLT